MKMRKLKFEVRLPCTDEKYAGDKERTLAKALVAYFGPDASMRRMVESHQPGGTREAEADVEEATAEPRQEAAPHHQGSGSRYARRDQDDMGSARAGWHGGGNPNGD